jgi:adenosine deaminase
MIDRSLPLIDLHRHLDGSVRLETVLELADQHGITLPARDVDGLRPHVQVDEREPGVMAFIARFRWLLEVMADPEACRRIAYENVEDAKAEGIDYLELRFSPWFMSERHGLDPAAVTEAVADGVEAGRRDFGLDVGLIGILSRTYGPAVARRELEALLTQRGRLVALDLAGDEAAFPAALFTEHFRIAREAGWQVTIHAGEAAGPESVWSSIRDLGATRIGHAVRAGEDPRLLDHMRSHGIGIEANLTSNVQTSAVPSYAAHPLKRYLDAGLEASINSDDPTISGIDLRHEFEVAAPAAGLTARHVRQAQQSALEMAFLSAERRRTLERSAGSRAL